ncbi:ATP-binding protein [Streptomyces sp. NPDC005968]|uniref:ATP-binding protein n=1 Tax=Streptomyces sp. NPDC005968 TaxID=3154574 RepID=UPI0033F8C6FD
MSSKAKQCTLADTDSPIVDRLFVGGPRTLSASPAAQLFMREACSVRRARGFIARTLHHWGVTERASDVILCAAELAANACEHTQPGADQFLVRVLLCQGTLRIEVHDRDPRHPARRNPGEGASSGRGLILVKGLADHYGVDPKPANGKAVWADFDITCTRECAALA